MEEAAQGPASERLLLRAARCGPVWKGGSRKKKKSIEYIADAPNVAVVSPCPQRALSLCVRFRPPPAQQVVQTAGCYWHVIGVLVVRNLSASIPSDMVLQAVRCPEIRLETGALACERSRQKIRRMSTPGTG